MTKTAIDLEHLSHQTGGDLALERELLTLRYRDGLGQRETAKRLGISQMQVSRLERRALSRLRAIEAQA